MSELISKLMNLSYELFGVILPGLILSLFILLVWVAIGPAIGGLTMGLIPPFTVTELQQFLDALSVVSGISIIVPLFVIWYFFGHILLWIARTGPRLDESENTGKRRLRLVLAMRIPKFENCFDSRFKPLLPQLYSAFKFGGGDGAEWRLFYPVAKCYLSRKLPTSLVATYQNKYTFHRSVAAAGALLFWLTVVGLFGSLVAHAHGGPPANWLLLLLLLLAAIAIVWGFSGSYLYHWQMFGNTLITETYSLTNGPDYVEPTVQESARD